MTSSFGIPALSPTFNFLDRVSNVWLWSGVRFWSDGRRQVNQSHRIQIWQRGTVLRERKSLCSRQILSNVFVIDVTLRTVIHWPGRHSAWGMPERVSGFQLWEWSSRAELRTLRKKLTKNKENRILLEKYLRNKKQM